MSWRRLLGLAPVCGPMPSAYFWPRNRSCLGLCLLQGCRARLPCIAIGHDPDRIINLRRPTHPRYAARPRSPIRSWVFGVLPDRDAIHARARFRSACHTSLLSRARCCWHARLRRPFSVLMGLLPGSARFALKRVAERASSLSEVRHLP